MKGISLYIHIPFCKSKCLYCDFCSYSGSEALMLEYTHALCDEIMQSCMNKKIDTIFIGGGTPTYLSLEAWKVLGETIKKLNTDSNLEFTVECNPGTLDENNIAILKDIGINRISIGLQSWQNKTLKRLGRIHSIEDFLNSYNMLRRYGFDNINIDIMFGLPDQSIEEFEETLKNVVGLQPEHISCYSLIIEENTPFKLMYEKGILNLPDEDAERYMYDKAISYLKSMGYEQYEISNFAKPGFRCRHNITYWKLDEYIGCGVAAHSYINKTRYRNEENVQEYIKKVYETGNAVVELNENSPKDEMEEYIFMGLRMMEGIDEENFYQRFGQNIYAIYTDIIDKYCGLALMEREGGKVFLTPKGVEISNSIMSDFIQ